MKLHHPHPPVAIQEGPRVATPTYATAPIAPPPPPLRRQARVDRPRRRRELPARTIAHLPTGPGAPFQFRPGGAAVGAPRRPAAARPATPANRTQPWDRRPSPGDGPPAPVLRRRRAPGPRSPPQPVCPLFRFHAAPD